MYVVWSTISPTFRDSFHRFGNSVFIACGHVVGRADGSTSLTLGPGCLLMPYLAFGHLYFLVQHIGVDLLVDLSVHLSLAGVGCMAATYC